MDTRHSGSQNFRSKREICAFPKTVYLSLQKQPFPIGFCSVANDLGFFFYSTVSFTQVWVALLKSSPSRIHLHGSLRFTSLLNIPSNLLSVNHSLSNRRSVTQSPLKTQDLKTTARAQLYRIWLDGFTKKENGLNIHNGPRGIPF